MNAKLKQKIRSWLLSAKPFVVRIDLHHVADKGNRVMQRFLREESRDIEEQADCLARDIHDLAQSNSDELGRLQTYSLVSYDADNSTVGSVVFRCASTRDDSTVSETEPATPTGQIAQQMRFNEALMRMLMGGYQATFTQLSSENAKLRDRNTALESVHFNMFSAMQDLMDRKNERDIEAAKAVSADERKAKMFEYLEKIAPFVLNKVTGLGEVEQFVGSLREEQMAKIFEMLDEDQKEKLGNVGALGEKLKLLGEAKKP